MDFTNFEFTVRDWLALGGVALILGVLTDAFRRLKEGQNDIIDNTSSADSGLDEEADDYTDFALLSELPNGGARLVNRQDELAQNSIATFSAIDIESASGASIDENKKGIRSNQEKLLLQEGSEVLALNVISRQGLQFAGDTVLKVLLEHDLRFGDMQFFHRHEEAAGRGAILFSVADMMKPGIFDIDNISALRTKGLVFFLTLPGPIHMLSVFEEMLDTATSIAKQLNGDLRDESRSVLTQQALEHHREKINELEHRRIARAQ